VRYPAAAPCPAHRTPTQTLARMGIGPVKVTTTPGHSDRQRPRPNSCRIRAGEHPPASSWERAITPSCSVATTCHAAIAPR
jgi:hypothetical protein